MCHRRRRSPSATSSSVDVQRRRGLHSAMPSLPPPLPRPVAPAAQSALPPTAGNGRHRVQPLPATGSRVNGRHRVRPRPTARGHRLPRPAAAGSRVQPPPASIQVWGRRRGDGDWGENGVGS
jgi:hypothetical protein